MFRHESTLSSIECTKSSVFLCIHATETTVACTCKIRSFSHVRAIWLPTQYHLHRFNCYNLFVRTFVRVHRDCYLSKIELYVRVLTLIIIRIGYNFAQVSSIGVQILVQLFHTFKKIIRRDWTLWKCRVGRNITPRAKLHLMCVYNKYIYII